MAKQTKAVAAAGHPAMDYPAHERTYDGFIKYSKLGVGFVILVLVLMAVFLL